MAIIEVLIIIKNGDDFCNNTESFINFLCVDMTLENKIQADARKIIDNSLKIEIEYQLDLVENEQKKERVYNLRLYCSDESRIDDFNKVFRKIKKICQKINPEQTQIYTIQDDVGSSYSNLAYPVIHGIENNLRKLISKFMLINVGIDWSKNAIQNGTFKDIKRGKNNEYINDYVQNLDFIDLSEILFKPYCTIEIDELYKRIKDSRTVGEIGFEFLKESIPKSNWERYFYNVLHIDAENLKLKWSKLYEIRNEVAHNKFLPKSKFEDLKSIVESINPSIDKALLNLNAIKLSKSEIDQIEFAINYNNTTPRLLAACKEFNLGKETLVEFLVGKGFIVDGTRPTSKLTFEMYEELKKEFKSNKRQTFLDIAGQVISGKYVH